MAAVLDFFLSNTKHEVVCESAGVGEGASRRGPASEFAIVAAKRLGLDLSKHRQRNILQVSMRKYDMIICVDGRVATRLMQDGVSAEKIYDAQITNPWPCHFQEDYDETFNQILIKMYRVVIRYFSD
jgi:protein-tyrosine-phosphatase